MSRITPQYQEFLKQIYRRARKERLDLVSKYNHNNDPIRQDSSKYDIKRPKRSKLTEEYTMRMTEKPEKPHKKVEHIETDIFNTIPKEEPAINSTRGFLRAEQEKNSKMIKPHGIKTTYHRKSGVSQVLKTEPNDDFRDYAKRSKKMFSSLDTFERIFSRGKTVSPPKSNYETENTISRVTTVRYPRMKKDHLKDLFENQEKYNDPEKENDIPMKPNNLSYRVFLKRYKLKI